MSQSFDLIELFKIKNKLIEGYDYACSTTNSKNVIKYSIEAIHTWIAECIKLEIPLKEIENNIYVFVKPKNYSKHFIERPNSKSFWKSISKAEVKEINKEFVLVIKIGYGFQTLRKESFSVAKSESSCNK